VVAAEPDPADPEDGDAAELGDEDADVVLADAVPAVPEPVDASATPETPAPSPAATMPVMMSRRGRAPDLETIGVPPFSTAAADRGWLVVRGSACAAGLP
jgi:hypothetical protein